MLSPRDRAAPPRSAAGTLVAGAHGFLGLAIVAALAEAGGAPIGLIRHPDHAEAVRRAGGDPIVGDVRDRAAVVRAARGCRGIVHVASAAGGPEAEARRIRIDGARTLARAAGEVGASRLVVGSGYWVYASTTTILHDDSPLEPRGESRVNLDTEEAAFEAAPPGVEVLVVRPGMVYGDGSWFHGMVDAIRGEGYPLPYPGTNRWSLIERSDAARAFVAVLERGRPRDAYLAVDDAPIEVGELVGLVARHLGRPLPAALSPERLRDAVGPDVAYHLAANRPASNARLRALGWAPTTPDPRVGVPRLLGTLA